MKLTAIHIPVSSFSEPPINVGATVAEGAYFKNDEVTLEFKGISVCNEKSWAIVGYDSGASSFAMTIIPSPGIEIKTNGSSHYKGDILKSIPSQNGKLLSTTSFL